LFVLKLILILKKTPQIRRFNRKVRKGFSQGSQSFVCFEVDFDSEKNTADLTAKYAKGFRKGRKVFFVLKS